MPATRSNQPDTDIAECAGEIIIRSLSAAPVKATRVNELLCMILTNRRGSTKALVSRKVKIAIDAIHWFGYTQAKCGNEAQHRGTRRSRCTP